jgi:hypothetical protein
MGRVWKYTTTTGVDEGVSAPTTLCVWSGPNPFTASITFGVALPSDGRIEVAIYDLTGREVAILEAMEGAGHRELHWDGRNMFGRPVASGIYAYRMTTPTGRAAGRIVRMR